MRGSTDRQTVWWGYKLTFILLYSKERVLSSGVTSFICEGGGSSSQNCLHWQKTAKFFFNSRLFIEFPFIWFQWFNNFEHMKSFFNEVSYFSAFRTLPPGADAPLTSPPHHSCAHGTWSARVREVYCMENRRDKYRLYLKGCGGGGERELEYLASVRRGM